MSAQFERAWVDLLGEEAGYSDLADDPGGKTMWGVTEAVARAHGYTGDMKDLPLRMAHDIAQSEYWYPWCDLVPYCIAFQVLSAHYNGGHPILWLQKAAGVDQDGIVGPATLSAVLVDPEGVAMRFAAAHIRYYTSLTTWAAFSKGWANRVANDLEKSSHG